MNKAKEIIESMLLVGIGTLIQLLISLGHDDILHETYKKSYEKFVLLSLTEYLLIVPPTLILLGFSLWICSSKMLNDRAVRK